MSTGNVKISQLSYLDNYYDYQDGSNIRIPLSQYNINDDNPKWESLGIKGDTLVDYIDSKLGVSISSSNHMVPLWNQIDYIVNTMLHKDIFYKLIKYLGYNKNMGNYTDITTLINSSGYITKYGEIAESTTFNYNPNPEHLKKGCLYVLEINNANGLPGVNDIDIPSDISWVTKISDLYHDNSAEVVYEKVYEPLPTHYLKLSDGGYGIPLYNYQEVSTYASGGGSQIAQGVLIFYASEDMDVILSLPTNYWDSEKNTSEDTKNLYEINFGLFAEFADQFLSIQGDLMKVLVESIVKNHKDIQALQANINSLGDVKANTIELDDYPVIQGAPMVVIKDRAPSAAGDNHGDDVPNKIGQIWVDINNQQAYIAVGLGSVDSWKPIKTV